MFFDFGKPMLDQGVTRLQKQTSTLSCGCVSATRKNKQFHTQRLDREHGREAIGLIVDMGEKHWSGQNMEVHPGQQIRSLC